MMIFVVSEFKSQITIESKKKQMNEEKMIKTFVGVGVSLVFTFAIQSTSFRSFDKKHKTQATYLPQTRKRINVQSQRRQSSKRVVVGEEEEEVSKQYQYQMRKENLIN